MQSLSANDAKTKFGEMLLQAQREPVQINKNGKLVAVVISAEEYKSIEALKLHFLQNRLTQAKADIQKGKTLDGEAFFTALGLGQHD